MLYPFCFLLRDYAFFVVGINVALRVSDLLSLTCDDLLKENGKTFKSIKLAEGKSGRYCDGIYFIWIIFFDSSSFK